MITFETYEDFEDAVMDVIAKRLEVIVEGGSLHVNVGVIDGETGELISEDDQFVG